MWDPSDIEYKEESKFSGCIAFGIIFVTVFILLAVSCKFFAYIVSTETFWLLISGYYHWIVLLALAFVISAILQVFTVGD